MTRKILYGAAVLLLAATAALTFTGKISWPPFGQSDAAARKNTAVEVTPLPVAVTRAEMSDFTQKLLLTGTLVAREEILVLPELEGFAIVKLHAEEGDKVKKGQVLAELVSDQLEARMAQNKASLAKAEASIKLAKSQIAEAEAVLAQSRADYDRAKILTRKGHLSASVYDQRLAASRTARARLAAARDGLAVVKADKAHIKAQRRELKWRLGNTKVRAPADGIISRRTARRGAMASAAAAALYRIIENGEIELDAEVPEADLPKLKAGQSARITVAGLGAVSGKVRLISPEVDRASRLGRVRIFIGVNPALHIGAFGRGIVETAKSKGIGIPLSAVLYGSRGAQVQVVKRNKVETRAVATGLVSGKLVEILDGLSDGELVVTRAGTFLRNGDVVRPVNGKMAVAGDAARVSGAN